MKNIFRYLVSGLTVFAFGFSIFIVYPAQAYYFNRLQLNRNDFSKIYTLASQGRTAELKSLILYNKLNIDTPNPSGDNGICVAVKYKDVIAYRTFRRLGANPRPNCSWRIAHFDDFVTWVEGKQPVITPTTIAKKEAATTISSGSSSSAWWWTGGALLAGGAAVAAGGGGGGSSGGGNTDKCLIDECNEGCFTNLPSPGNGYSCQTTNKCGGCESWICPNITCSTNEICTASNACGGCEECTNKCLLNECDEGCFVDLPQPGENYTCRSKNDCGGCEEWLPTDVEGKTFSRYFATTAADNEGEISKEYSGEETTWGGLFSYLKSLTNKAFIHLNGSDGAIGIMSAQSDDLDTALSEPMVEGNASIINQGDITINANKSIGMLVAANNNNLLNDTNTIITINGNDGTGIAGYGQNNISNKGSISLVGSTDSFIAKDDVEETPLRGYFIDRSQENSGMYLNLYNYNGKNESFIDNSGDISLDYVNASQADGNTKYASIKGMSVIGDSSSAAVQLNNSGNININYSIADIDASDGNVAMGIQAVGNGNKTEGVHDSTLTNSGNISLSGNVIKVGLAAHNIEVENLGNINLADPNQESAEYGVIVSGNSKLTQSGDITLSDDENIAIAMIGGSSETEEGTSVTLEAQDDDPDGINIEGDIEILGANNNLNIGTGVTIDGNIETQNYYNNSINNSGIINAQNLQATTIVNSGEISLSGVSQLTVGSFSNNGTLKLEAGTEITPIYIDDSALIDISGVEFTPNSDPSAMINLHAEEEIDDVDIYKFKMCDIDLSSIENGTSTVLKIDLNDRAYDRYNIEIGNWELADSMSTALDFEGESSAGGELDLNITGEINSNNLSDSLIKSGPTFQNTITIAETGSIKIRGDDLIDDTLPTFYVFDLSGADYNTSNIINNGSIIVDSGTFVSEDSAIVTGVNDFVNNGSINSSITVANSNTNNFTNNGTITTSTKHVVDSGGDVINNGTINHLGNGNIFNNVSSVYNNGTINTAGNFTVTSNLSLTNNENGMIQGITDFSNPREENLIEINSGTLVNDGTVEYNNNSIAYAAVKLINGELNNTGTISNMYGIALLIQGESETDYEIGGTIKGHIPVRINGDDSGLYINEAIETSGTYGIVANNSNVYNKGTIKNTNIDTSVFAINATSNDENADNNYIVSNEGTIEIEGKNTVEGIYAVDYDIINEEGCKIKALANNGTATGIHATSSNEYSISNYGEISVTGDTGGYGIYTYDDDDEIKVNILNYYESTITVKTNSGDAKGIYVQANNASITNNDGINVSSSNDGYGIHVDTNSPSTIIKNVEGSIEVNSVNDGYGIYATASTAEGTVEISSDAFSGITVESGNNGYGIWVESLHAEIKNGGNINVSAGYEGYGIYTLGRHDIENSGNIKVRADTAYGIYAPYAKSVVNSGDITIENAMYGVGIYAPDAALENEGNINLDCETGSNCLQTKNSSTYSLRRMVNNGRITSNSTMSFSGENSSAQTTVLGANGIFKAPKLSGTLFVASDTTTGSNEDEYVEEKALVADKIDVNVESESVMFASSLVNNSGSANVLMTRKSFDSILEDQELAEYLEQNYQDGSRVDLFDDLKNASSTNELMLASDKVLGRNFFPLLALQNQQRVRNFSQTMEDLVLGNANLKDERSVVVFNNYYNDQDSDKSYIGYEDRVTGVSALFDKAMSKDYRFGVGFGLYNAYTDFDNNDSRRDSIMQVYATNRFDFDKFGALIMPFGGYGHGEYKRYANGVKNEPGFDVWYAGINNRVFLKNNIGGWKFEPTAELNISNVYQGKIKEKHNTTVKSNNSLSAEAGIGAYVKNNIDFGEKGSLELGGGVMYYRELNNNTYDDVKASIIGMNGEYSIKGYNNDLNRAELSLKAEYKINSWSIYGELMQNFGGDNDNTIYNAGIKLAF